MKTYNFSNLMEQNPTIFEQFINSLGQLILLAEHPTLGDMSYVIAICEELEVAEDTCFFECDDMLAEHKEYEPKFINRMLYIGDSPCNDLTNY